MSDSISTVDVNQDRGFGVIEFIDLIEKAENRTQIEELSGPNGYDLLNPYENFTYKGQNHTKLEILYFYNETLNEIIADFNDPTSALYDDFKPYRPRLWNEFNVTFHDIAIYSNIEQWAKCLSYDEGTDLHDSEPLIPEGTFGLEPAGPGKLSGIPMEAAMQLWNESYEYSLLNFPNGIQMWYDALTDSIEYNKLLNEFSQYPGFGDGDWNENYTYGDADWGFNETDMNLILDWLWGQGGGWSHGSFSEYLLSKLIEANYNKTIEEFAFQILLEQWTNGTVMKHPLYPKGFTLLLGFKDVRGFEIGYQEESQIIIPTNISSASALAFWNISSEFSLVTKTGLNKWFAAEDGDSDARLMLQSKFGFTNEQMDLLLDWIPNFQHNLMPYLAQYQLGLPTDSITLGNIIQVAVVGVGAACIGSGGIGIASNLIIRRKRLNPFESEG